VDQPDPLGAQRVEPPAAGEEGAGVGLADLRDDERADDRRQDPEARLGEPESGPAFGDDDVGHGTQAHPAAERRPMDPGDDRRRAGVDRLEHLGHGHRIRLVGVPVEGHRGTHPGDVRAGAEARPGAPDDDCPELDRGFLREPEEGSPELGDERGVEGVVDGGSIERHSNDDVARTGPFDAQPFAHPPIVGW